ncbi:MAG: hypothetical protein WCT12_30005 [Verrucomicrobiota bacterium]
MTNTLEVGVDIWDVDVAALVGTVMMNYTTRRTFLRAVGGFGLALGTHPLLGIKSADAQLSLEIV